MNIRSLKHNFKEGFKAILKNRVMSLASILTVVACAFILITSLIICLNIDATLENAEKGIGICVYLGDEMTDDEVSALKSEISKIEHITKIDYISKEAAYNWAKEHWGDSDILDGLEKDNPFPRSFELKLDGAEYQVDVINKLDGLQLSYEKKLIESRGIAETQTEILSEVQSEATTQQVYEIGQPGYQYIGIESIQHAAHEAQMLYSISFYIRIISVILILILGIIAVTIITNTIKLTVFIRKNEINIMKYIGATDWFIRGPFIVEGMLIGMIGSVIPIIICWVGYDGLISFLNEKLSFIMNLVQFKSGLEIFSIVAPTTIILGSLLGVIGSVISIRKHLNV